MRSINEVKARCWELARAMISEVVREMREKYPDYDPTDRKQMIADAARDLYRQRVRRKR